MRFCCAFIIFCRIRALTVSRSFEVFDKVRFTVYASFELEPILGNGEALYTSESRVEELVGGTYREWIPLSMTHRVADLNAFIVITFSPGESGTTAPGPSLLITLGRWYSNRLAVAPSGDDSNVISPVVYVHALWLTTRWQLESEESSALVLEKTGLGQEALLRYYNEYQREDLENATQHFECAWRNCLLTHRCRAVVLVNLAKAKFLSSQIDLTSTNLDESIPLYQQALDLRPSGHPDRPATLLQLAQALLFRYEKQGCNESDADEIKKLMTNPQDFTEDSHECRAADLVLETLERCRVVNSGNSDKLENLIRKLEDSVKVPPNDYFDIPQRFINLSTALWRRYKKHGKLDDLDHLLGINKQALQLLPGRHPDRLPVLRIVGVILWRLFEIHGDLSYLEQLISPSVEALQLIPEGYPERPYWVGSELLHHNFVDAHMNIQLRFYKLCCRDVGTVR
jgi:tetratricopeptide (TPR) repeat protein